MLFRADLEVCSLRYELGKDVFIAPYDWRLAGDGHEQRRNGVGGYYPHLQALIEQAVQACVIPNHENRENHWTQLHHVGRGRHVVVVRKG